MACGVEGLQAIVSIEDLAVGVKVVDLRSEVEGSEAPYTPLGSFGSLSSQHGRTP